MESLKLLLHQQSRDPGSAGVNMRPGKVLGGDKLGECWTHGKATAQRRGKQQQCGQGKGASAGSSNTNPEREQLWQTPWASDSVTVFLQWTLWDPGTETRPSHFSASCWDVFTPFNQMANEEIRNLNTMAERKTLIPRKSPKTFLILISLGLLPS